MSNIKILVVDDEHRIRKLIRASLAKEGYHIDEAESGHAAMDLLSLNNYDLILLDIMLGDTDGFTLIRTIKEMKIATKDGYIQVLSIQFPGKKKMSTPELLNGMAFSGHAKAY